MKVLKFISLRFNIISLQCIDWILLSLKKDEMLPSERAIQSRIKEAFAHKVAYEVWIEFMHILSNQKFKQIEISQDLIDSKVIIKNERNMYYWIQ